MNRGTKIVSADHRSVRTPVDCVYVCWSKRQDGYKIGHGAVTGPNNRLQSHRTACPDIELVAAVAHASAHAIEQSLLAFFATERRGESEWVDNSARVKDWVMTFGAKPNVARTPEDVALSWSEADLWPWFEHRPPLGDGGFPELITRDYRPPIGHGKGITSSRSEDWYTDPLIPEAVRELYGGVIDLDPMSCAEANLTVRADNIYTAQSDGLRHAWFGKVFLNPPWGGSGRSSAKRRAVDLALNYYAAGEVEAVTIVVNANATTTAWFAPLFDYPICFPNFRFQHHGPGGKTGASNTGTIIVYIGRETTRFVDIFKGFGAVVLPGARGEGRPEDWDPDEEAT